MDMKAAETKVPERVPTRGGYVHPIQRLHDEMDRIFDGFFGRNVTRWPGSLLDWDWEPFRELRGGAPMMKLPQVDVREDEKQYAIEAELPGMSDKDIELEIKEDVLTLKGEKKEEMQEEKKNYLRCERSYGSFERSFALPESVDRDKIDATFKNGVLTITLPKTAKAQTESKKIEIKA